MNQIKKKQYLRHLLRYQKWYLLLLMLLILSLPFLLNFINEKPALIGGEGYYHLNNAQQSSWKNLYYFGLQPLESTFFNLGFVLIPLSLAVLSLLLFFPLAKKMKLSPGFSFFFLFFTIISPAFIFSYTTISSCSLLVFLTLGGFFLRIQKNQFCHYLALLPFLAATFIDLFSGLIMIIIQVSYIFKTKNRTRLSYFPLGIISLFFLVNWLFFQKSFTLGPFHQQNLLSDLISDLGGLSGISFFLILLALIGLTLIWKKDRSLSFTYLLLPFLILIYIYNTETIFLFSLLITLFATIGFLELIKRKWTLKILKNVTILLLILGLFFSVSTYLNRVINYGPSSTDLEALAWIKFNTEKDVFIYSLPENSPKIEYFAQRQTFSQFSDPNKETINDQIFTSTYIQDLFPILEENKISLLYITPQMKSNLPPDQGLLFLFKNERFKLLYSREGLEVWGFS